MSNSQRCATDSSASSSLTRRAALGYLAGGVGLICGLKSSVVEAQTEGSSRFGARPPKNGFVSIGGVNIYYEEQGQGVPVVLCPPGRSAAESARPGAAKLASKYRVISWDRPNTPGRSDIVFKGSSDVDLWADQLKELLRRLKASPAYLVEGSMGVRTNFAAAVRYPDIARGLFIYLASGNNLWPSLPQRYWADHADVAEKGGMRAVVETPYWSDVIRRNPGNRARLLKTDPQEFSRVMRRWTGAYKKSDVVLEMTEGNAHRHTENGVPTRIIAGCAWDNSHSREHTELIKGVIPNAEFIDQPRFCDEFKQAEADAEAYAKKHNEVFVAPYYEVPSLFPLIDDFITKTEAKRKA